ncbi:hypothetical protein ACSBR1_009245 [Camellia fascicularis]
MAGVDYMECDIDLEAWERCGQEQPPSYLLAEKHSSNYQNVKKGITVDKLIIINGELVMRAKILEWAMAVASMKNASGFEKKNTFRDFF